MSHIKRKASRPAVMAILVTVALVGCLGLAACGGSSSKTTTAASAASVGGASGASGPYGATGGRARFGALRECLKKNGINLPERTPGQPRPGGATGGFFGGGAGAKLPKGVTPAEMQAALRKCGRGFGAGLRGVNTPAFKAAFTKFVACMHENGITLPAPNTSGNGPVFNSKGLDTSSAKFMAAEAKCRADLPGPPRAGGPSGAGAGPPPGATSGGGSEPG